MSMIAGLAALTPAQLDELHADPDSAEGWAYTQDAARLERTIALDKAWHGLHWLLTGKAWGGAAPLGLAILGGQPIGPEMDYGPARFLTPAQAGIVAAALAAVTPDDLARHFDPAAMDAQNIYPTAWAIEGDAGLGFLRPYFDRLARFYADAAARGDGVLQWIA